MRAGQLALGLAAVGIGTIAVVYGRRNRAGLSGTEAEDARDRRDTAFHKIWDLMHDPDPAALDVAEDLAMEHGIRLREYGRSSSSTSSLNGSFVLSPWGPADAPTTRVSWAVVPFSQGRGEIGYQTELSVLLDDVSIMPSHVVREIAPHDSESMKPGEQRRRERARETRREQATQYAVHDAWRVAQYIKRAKARGVTSANIAIGIVNDIPTPIPKERLRRKELYGRKTRRRR